MATVIAKNRRKSATLGKGLPVSKTLPPKISVIYDDGDVVLMDGVDEIVRESVDYGMANCGCAVQDFDGLTTFTSVYDNIPSNTLQLSEKRKMIKDCMVNMFNEIKADRSAAFIVCSNNDNGASNKIINELMDEICDSATVYKKSPKTKNNIRVWVV